jgi:hypothetical protein
MWVPKPENFEWMDFKNLSIDSLVAQNIRQSRKLGVPSVCAWHLPIQRRTILSQRGFWIGLCVVTLFGYASVAFSLSPHKQIDQYVHDSWNSRHDFPGEAVYQILQTSDGYLWLRTAGGLIRFDGVHFVPMDAVVGKEPVKAIAMSIEGGLLIRTTSRTVITKPINIDELEAAILTALHDTTEVDNNKIAEKHKGEKNAFR